MKKVKFAFQLLVQKTGSQPPRWIKVKYGVTLFIKLMSNNLQVKTYLMWIVICLRVYKRLTNMI